MRRLWRVRSEEEMALWPRAASLYKVHSPHSTKCTEIKSVRLDVITTRGSKDEDQEKGRREERAPGPEQQQQVTANLNSNVCRSQECLHTFTQKAIPPDNIQKCFCTLFNFFIWYHTRYIFPSCPFPHTTNIYELYSH